MTDKKGEQDTSFISSKVMERIDIDELINCIADEVTGRLMSSIATDSIVDKVFESKKVELQAVISDQIIEICNRTDENEIATIPTQKKRKTEHSDSAPAA